MKSTVPANSQFTPTQKGMKGALNTMEKVTMFVNARSLICPGVTSINSFGVLIVVEPSGKLVPIGFTEVVPDSATADYSQFFLVDYHFEVVQEMILRIYHQANPKVPVNEHEKHPLIGGITFRLENLMRSDRQSIISAMQGGSGIIEIRGESVTTSRDNFCVAFSASKLSNKEGFFSKSDPFLLISRINEDHRWTVVWKNEKIDNNLNPHWSAAKIPIALLNNGDYDRPLKIEIYDHEKSGKHVYMGEVRTSLRDLLLSNNKPLNVIEPEKKKNKKGYVNSGTLTPGNCSVEHNSTLTDFITGGCDIQLLVAIDFTQSNGDPSLPSSLHYSDPTGRMNPYEETIVAVGNVLEPYDTDKMYPVYGFGAKMRMPDGSLSPAQHCFPVYSGGLEVHGVEGILQAYRDAKANVTFSGPTLFAPLIRTATQYAANLQCSQENQKYCILLILTDGVINDFDASKQAIVDASYTPLSIIIVGIGKAEFYDMVELDSDDKLLTFNNKTASRDIVQFVSMRDFQGLQAVGLSQHVLAEVPGQLLLYMQQNSIRPKPSLHAGAMAGNYSHLRPLTTSAATAAVTTSASAPPTKG